MHEKLFSILWTSNIYASDIVKDLKIYNLQEYFMLHKKISVSCQSEDLKHIGNVKFHDFFKIRVTTLKRMVELPWNEIILSFTRTKFALAPHNHS